MAGLLKTLNKQGAQLKIFRVRLLAPAQSLERPCVTYLWLQEAEAVSAREINRAREEIAALCEAQAESAEQLGWERARSSGLAQQLEEQAEQLRVLQVGWASELWLHMPGTRC